MEYNKFEVSLASALKLLLPPSARLPEFPAGGYTELIFDFEE
jgi:hypothetical protein